MDTQELANALFGASRIENTSPKTMNTLQGVAVSDSVDGKVKVKLLNAESVPEENDATEENTVVELLTTPAVKEGDTVVVTAEGGVLKTMSVTGNYGSGDKQTADTEEAKKVATNYIDIDENKGITVGNMQESTLGHNTYIDANGVSIRDGEMVLASFEDDEIRIGEHSENAEISLCGEQGTCSFFENPNITSEKMFQFATRGDTPVVLDTNNGKGKALIATFPYLPVAGGTNEGGAFALGCGDDEPFQNGDLTPQNMSATIVGTSNDRRQELRLQVSSDNSTVLKLSTNEGATINDRAISLQGHEHVKSDITDLDLSSVFMLQKFQIYTTIQGNSTTAETLDLTYDDNYVFFCVRTFDFENTDVICTEQSFDNATQQLTLYLYNKNGEHTTVNGNLFVIYIKKDWLA